MLFFRRVKQEKQIKQRAEESRFTQSTEKPSPYSFSTTIPGCSTARERCFFFAGRLLPRISYTGFDPTLNVLPVRPNAHPRAEVGVNVGVGAGINLTQLRLKRYPLPPVNLRYKLCVPLAPLILQDFVAHVCQPPVPDTAHVPASVPDKLSR
jgi:hypothetical protein